MLKGGAGRLSWDAPQPGWGCGSPSWWMELQCFHPTGLIRPTLNVPANSRSPRATGKRTKSAREPRKGLAQKMSLLRWAWSSLNLGSCTKTAVAVNSLVLRHYWYPFCSYRRVAWTLNQKVPLNPFNLKTLECIIPTEFNRIILMPKFKALQDQSLSYSCMSWLLQSMALNLFLLKLSRAVLTTRPQVFCETAH